MKVFASLAASLLITAILLSFLPVHGEEIVYENVIRFHVLAESDTAEDQALKLKVRDAVLEAVSPMLSECRDFEEALALLEKESGHIKNIAEETIKENGYSYTASAQLLTEEYPTRIYDEIALPSGVYTSMKITIGTGEGKNWWCVLFPSVCNSFSVVPKKDTDSEYIAAGFTPEQYRTINKNSAPVYKVRFKVLEMLSDLLGFEY